MQISLIEVVDGNPFNLHPQLNALWPDDLLQVAIESVDEYLHQRPLCEQGTLYTINLDDKVIGVTGYFPYWENKSVGTLDELDSFGLRWHGVIEAYRGNGYAKQAMSEVAKVILEKHQEAKFLYELMPIDQDATHRDQYFRAHGFLPHGPQEKFSWHDKLWQPYIANLSELANLNNKPSLKI